MINAVNEEWTKMPVNVTVGSSVSSIGSDVFAGCSGLTSVTIPNSVTNIGNSAFSGCSGMTSVTIPDSVMSIGLWAFDSYTSLIYVVIPTKTMTQVHAMSYTNWSLSSGCKICCSDGVIEIN